MTLKIIIDHIKKIARKHKLKVSTKQLGIARILNTRLMCTQVKRGKFKSSYTASIVIRQATGKAVAQILITGPTIQAWVIGAIKTIDINDPDSLDIIEDIIANLDSEQIVESEADIQALTTVYLKSLDIR